MTSGRYTAYHIYQDLSFPEAQKAATRPYKLPEYQCAHSQRGYLFQFDNMVERTHFDAANTTCCDQPVLNFANKPQYAEASRPMNPQDCGARVKAAGCTVLEVYVEDAQAMCAQSSARIRRIKIKCPGECPDLRRIQGGGKLDGRYGTFRSLGMEAGDVLILDYTPDPDMISGWFDNCSGTGTLTEEFCGGYTISYSLRAGLENPNGCGCDCCGVHGSFSSPVMTVSAPAAISADWYNTVSIPGSVTGNQSCSGGSLQGTFAGRGSSSVRWDSATQYNSDGSSRYVSRDPGYVGASSNPACCGGTIRWSGTDGCGGGDSAVTTITRKIGSSRIYPAAGSTLHENGYGSFSGWQACAYAAAANMTVSRSCLSNSVSQAQRSNGKISAGLMGPIRFSATHACSGCCGNGHVHVTFRNGCGGSYAADYNVRRSISNGNKIGYLYKCIRYYSFGWRYKPVRAPLYCDGRSGAFDSGVFGGYHSTLQGCLGQISGRSAMGISGAGGCRGDLTGSTACCWYSDNGGGGYGFRSRIHAVSGATCCNIETQNGAWVNSGTGARCCPST
jgi:hypothetical protein